MITGIYCIRNLITGEFYIGSASRGMIKRWGEHRTDLRAGHHHNLRLQAAWRFYGESSFRFAVVEECPPEKCIEREQWFLDIFDPVYNICRVAGAPMAGRKMSLETRAKMSLSHKGQKLGNKYGLGNKSRTGQTISLETREKMRVAMTGRHHSEASHRAMSRAQKGRVISLEHRRKISASLKGRPLSAETCRKMSISRIGKHHSLEVRRKMSISQQRRYHPEIVHFARNLTEGERSA